VRSSLITTNCASSGREPPFRQSHCDRSLKSFPREVRAISHSDRKSNKWWMRLSLSHPPESQRLLVGASLRWCGLDMKPEKNRTVIDVEGKLSSSSSALQALVILTEEGLQIAYECSQAL
jgi:hypothetical protein